VGLARGGTPHPTTLHVVCHVPCSLFACCGMPARDAVSLQVLIVPWGSYWWPHYVWKEQVVTLTFGYEVLLTSPPPSLARLFVRFVRGIGASVFVRLCVACARRFRSTRCGRRW
jgi:hypothetical protein